MNSKQYWAKRESEALKHRIVDERQYDRRINQIYTDMLDGVQKEIDSFYGRYAHKEGLTLSETKKRVSQLDIEAYERKAKRYVREKNFSKQANEEMRLYNLTMKVNRLEMLKANIGLELISGHQELDNFMRDILKGRTEDELKRQAGILGKSIKNNAQKADAIVNASFHSATFSDRIWQYQSLMKSDLSKLLQTGLIQGKNPRVLARDLKKQFGTSTYNAERLMRTELARVQTEAQKQSFERNGFDKYEFIVNTGCCDICAGLNGKRFMVSNMKPGINAPPMHPHCRCSTAAYEDSAEYEAWLDYLDKGGTTEEWEKLKPVITQKKKKISEGVFDTYNITQADSIRPRSVMNDLKKSKIGTDTLKYIEDENVPVRLCYGVDNPEGHLGVYDPFDDVIIVYCDQTKTIAETSLTVIHEAKHRMQGSRGTFAEEVECFKAEHLHKNNTLTENDISGIIERVKKLYPDLV